MDEFLYDGIGRRYKRLNRYLEEVAVLQEKIKAASGSEKTALKEELSKVRREKDKNPYIIKLSEFRKREKEYRENLKKETEEFARSYPGERDMDLRKENFRAEKDSEFYRNYKDLDYDAKLKYEVAELKKYHLPKIIEFRNKTENELKVALEKEKNISSAAKEKGREVYKDEVRAAKLKFEDDRKVLKDKKRQGLISAKALSNGTAQLKKELKSHIEVKRNEIPDIGVREDIRTLRYDLKEKTSLMTDILNKDIADVRRKTPVETEEVFPWKSIVTIPIPGLGQLLNGQPLKAFLFFLGTLFTYLVAVPYALGYGNYQGQGIFGLFTLAEGAPRIHKSQIYMIEGILACAFLSIALTIILVSFFDSLKTEKGIIRGTREENTFEVRNSMQEKGFPYFVSLPALIFILFIVIVPLMTTVLLSFADMDPNHQSKFAWAGFKNYISVIQGRGVAGQAFWNILTWTVIWTLAATTLAILTGFGLALLANNPRIKGKGLIRVIYLLPWAVPAFVTIMFFSLLMGPGGFISNMVNQVSAFFGGNPDIRIKSDTNATRMALIFLQVWLGSSYVFLLSTGVLQGIPDELYEAAEIDGASPLQRIMKITVPLVLFQTAPLLVGQYTFNFNNFNIIYLFNKGGPFDTSKYGNLAGSSDLLISYIYKLTMESKYQSLAAAITLLISLALMFFAFIGFRNSKAFKEEKL